MVSAQRRERRGIRRVSAVTSIITEFFIKNRSSVVSQQAEFPREADSSKWSDIADTRNRCHGPHCAGMRRGSSVLLLVFSSCHNNHHDESVEPRRTNGGRKGLQKSQGSHQALKYYHHYHHHHYHHLHLHHLHHHHHPGEKREQKSKGERCSHLL